MKESYTTDYLKIYLWNGIAIILNFVSMFIVVPMLSTMPVVYGIYMLCISFTLFFAYADIGFLKAAFKYANEYYAQNNLIEEIKVFAFGNFIYFIFIAIYSLLLIVLSIYPDSVINDLSNLKEKEIASALFLVLAVYSYNSILDRFVNNVFAVRVEGFIYQRILIVSNIIKIVSVFYFFNGKYDIVGYFMFFQSMNLVSNIIGLIIIKKRYSYDFKLLLRYFKFSKEIYLKVKKLAFSSVIVSLLWMVYYNFDKLAIAKFLGAEEVAIYSVGFTLATFFKTFSGTIFGPFNARFNHYVGLKNFEGLKEFFRHVIIITLPLVVFPLLSALLLIKPLILSWVGSAYLPSVSITSYLLLAGFTAFISYPSSIVLLALEKVKPFIFINLMLVLIFWIGVFFSVKYWQVDAFAIFNFVSQLFACVFYLILTISILKITFKNFLIKILSPAIFPVLFLIISLTFISNYLPIEKNKLNLLIVIATGGLGTFFAILIYYFNSKEFSSYFNNLISKLLKYRTQKVFKQINEN